MTKEKKINFPFLIGLFFILTLPFSLELLVWRMADWAVTLNLVVIVMALLLIFAALLFTLLITRSRQKILSLSFALMTFFVVWMEVSNLFDSILAAQKLKLHIISYALASIPGALIALMMFRFFSRIISKKIVSGTLILVSAATILFNLFFLSGGGRRAHQPPHPDVVFVVMDTTRADHLSVYGYSRPTTPGLAWLARDGVVYENAMSPASWTPPGHASLLTGLLPAEHGTDGDFTTFDPPGPCLPELLQEQEYSTCAIVNNPFMDPSFGWDRGFDKYRITWKKPRISLSQIIWLFQRIHEDWPWFGSTARTLQAAKRWWLTHDKAPRFLFLNLIDPHSPYGEPHRFKNAFLDETTRNAGDIPNDSEVYDAGVVRAEGKPLERVIARYDGDILYMDFCLESFFRWLEIREELDQTLVICTSDHGERLGERGLLGHQLGLDQSLLQVPLIVRYPPKIPAGRRTKLVLTHGIFSTLLEILGMNPPSAQPQIALPLDDQQLAVTVAQMRHQENYLRNLKDIASEFDPSPFAGDWFSVYDGEWKLIRSTSGSLYLFNIQNDPSETSDLSRLHTDEIERLSSYLDGLPAFDRGKNLKDMSKEVVELLKSLGYIR